MKGWTKWSSTGSSGILCVIAPNHHRASTLAPKRGHLICGGKNKVWKCLSELTGRREKGDMVMFVSLWCCASNCLSSLLRLVWERCQWVPSPVLTAATHLSCSPVYPHVKCYPLYRWRWAAALWHTQGSGLLPGLLWWPKSGFPRACSLGRVSCPSPLFFIP